MKKILILIFTLSFVFNASANQQASTESVEKLMELTEVSKMIDAMYSQITGMFDGMSKQMGITEEERPAFDKYMNKVVLLLKEDMNWNSFKGPMIEIYTKRFSEDEIQGLIKFYQSELGQSTVKKMPLIMQDSMAISQEIFKDFMPKIQALAVEMQNELKTKRQQTNK